MPLRFSDTKWLDIAIKAVGVLVILAVLFFGYTVIATNARDKANTPAMRAAKNLMQAVRKDPNNVAARLRLADALAAAGDFEGAAEQYQAALQIRKDDPQALAGLALLAMNQEEWRTAEGYWRKIVDLLKNEQYASVDQRLEKAYFYLGSTLMEVKEYEDAVTYLREALRIRRDASDTYFLLAIAYKNMDNPTKFEENLRYALQFDPLLPEANYEYALLLLDNGQVADAAERLRTSVDNAPPDRKEPALELAKLGTAEEHLEAAKSAVASKETSSALSEARIAAAIDPENVDALRIVAQMWEKQGNVTAAQAAWDKLLGFLPDDEEALAAVKRLSKSSAQ